MEKSPFELLVEEALLETAAREWAPSFSDGGARPPPYSVRYLAWEKRLLRNPFGYAKKHSRPVWQRALRSAACVLLAVSVAFGGVLAVNPTARAWVQQIIAEWFGDHARFSFTGAAGQETGDWRTGYLPEGFELAEETTMSGISNLIYKNIDGVNIKFRYAPTTGSNFSVDSEHQTHKEITINKNSGYLLYSTILGESNTLVWTDMSSGVAFRLTSTIIPDELIKIAKSVVSQS